MYLVKYCHVYAAHNDIESSDEIIGFSSLDAYTLFNVLRKEYPDIPIRHRVRHTWAWLDIHGKNDLPYKDFIFFEEGKLKKFSC